MLVCVSGKKDFLKYEFFKYVSEIGKKQSEGLHFDCGLSTTYDQTTHTRYKAVSARELLVYPLHHQKASLCRLSSGFHQYREYVYQPLKRSFPVGYKQVYTSTINVTTLIKNARETGGQSLRIKVVVIKYSAFSERDFAQINENYPIRKVPLAVTDRVRNRVSKVQAISKKPWRLK